MASIAVQYRYHTRVVQWRNNHIAHRGASTCPFQSNALTHTPDQGASTISFPTSSELSSEDPLTAQIQVPLTLTPYPTVYLLHLEPLVTLCHCSYVLALTHACKEDDIWFEMVLDIQSTRTIRRSHICPARRADKMIEPETRDHSSPPPMLQALCNEHTKAMGEGVATECRCSKGFQTPQPGL